MKKAVRLVVVGLVALALSACTGTGMMSKKETIKCPSCGYEITAPMGG